MGSLVIGLVAQLGLALFDPSHVFREGIVPALIMLPLFLLGGHLTAVWQWRALRRSIPKIDFLLGSGSREHECNGLVSTVSGFPFCRDCAEGIVLERMLRLPNALKA